jgi:hypothetical protein
VITRKGGGAWEHNHGRRPIAPMGAAADRSPNRQAGSPRPTRATAVGLGPKVGKFPRLKRHPHGCGHSALIARGVPVANRSVEFIDESSEVHLNSFAARAMQPTCLFSKSSGEFIWTLVSHPIN